jgi:hypothetical protein
MKRSGAYLAQIYWLFQCRMLTFFATLSCTRACTHKKGLGIGGNPGVRFTPESGHVRCNYGCPLWADITVLFDQLVGYLLHLPRNCKAERVRSL